MPRSAILLAYSLWLTLSVHFAMAQEVVRVGVLTDLSGSFAAWSGKGSVVAAQLAAEDFQKALPDAGFKVEILSADHQNKPDIASGIARRWMNDGVNAIADVPNSAAALAVNTLLRGSSAVLLVSGAGLDSLVGKDCSPNTIAWTYQTSTVGGLSARSALGNGGGSWYFISSDYVGGRLLEDVATTVLVKAGTKVLGHTLPALGTTDFSSYLLQAQASNAKVIGLAMVGGELVTLMKQAGEFGITRGGQSLVALAGFANDVHAVGLQDAQGLTLVTPFYWDLNDGTRAFAARFASNNNGDYPSQVQAGVYAAVLHYLKAAAAAGTRNGPTVVAKMKQMPTEDPLFGKGIVRADGRHLHNFYVTQVKAPSQSTKPWDDLQVIRTILPEEAYPPANPDECPLVK